MTAVTYIGQFPDGQVDGDDKPFIEQHGYLFHPGQSTKVDDERVVEKLAANRFFKVAGKSDKEEAERAADEAEKAEADDLRAWLAEHGFNPHHKTGLDKLRQMKADHLVAQAKAEEA